MWRVEKEKKNVLILEWLESHFIRRRSICWQWSAKLCSEVSIESLFAVGHFNREFVIDRIKFDSRFRSMTPNSSSSLYFYQLLFIIIYWMIYYESNNKNKTNFKYFSFYSRWVSNLIDQMKKKCSSQRTSWDRFQYSKVKLVKQFKMPKDSTVDATRLISSFAHQLNANAKSLSKEIINFQLKCLRSKIEFHHCRWAAMSVTLNVNRLITWFECI